MGVLVALFALIMQGSQFPAAQKLGIQSSLWGFLTATRDGIAQVVNIMQELKLKVLSLFQANAAGG